MAMFLADLYDSTKYMCQVFYHKLKGINHWKATLAFFTKEKQVVEKNAVVLYFMLNILMFVQNVNTGYWSNCRVSVQAWFQFFSQSWLQEAQNERMACDQ